MELLRAPVDDTVPHMRSHIGPRAPCYCCHRLHAWWHPLSGSRIKKTAGGVKQNVKKKTFPPFKLFDSDRSGSLEWESETTELLRALYPSLRASVEEDVFYQIEAHLGLNPEAGVPCPRVVRSFSCAPVFIELTSGSPSVLSMRNEQGA